MISRSIAFGLAAVFACMTAASALTPQADIATNAGVPRSSLRVYGGRTGAQAASRGGAKLDAMTGSVVRHLPNLRGEHALSELRALNPAMHFRQPAGSAEPQVLIDAVTRGDPAQLRATLSALGLQKPAQYSNDVGGWLPVSQLQTASLQGEVHSIRAAMPHTRSGVVTSQGDIAIGANTLRSQDALDGSGITVGVLSDSYDCYAQYASQHLTASGYDGYANNGFTATATQDITTGDLPASGKINILEDGSCDDYDPSLQLPLSDEGRAMMQVVHDVAPGASLAFYTADNSEADFASGITKLAAATSAGGAGAQVLVDDVGYYDEPFFQDGLLAQAVTSVVSAGAVYVSAAGNDGQTAYDNTAPSFTVAGTGNNAGEQLLTFDSTHGTSLPLSIGALDPGWFIAVVVEWDQPYITGSPNSGGATSQIDLCVTGSGSDAIINDDGSTLTSQCTGLSTLHQDPVQVLLIGNPASASAPTAAENVNLVLGLKGGGIVPGRIKLAVEADGITVTLPTTAPTIQGHPNAAAAIAVGAAPAFQTPACGASGVTMETYSSRGGDPELFSSTGTALSSPVARAKPDLVGPDGGNNTFLGYQDTAAPTTGSCADNSKYPNFYGTSAASPHVAAVAALLLQADPSLTPSAVRSALVTGALATNEAADFQGAGFVQATAAIAAVPVLAPAAPVLSLASATITLGQSTTLSWTSSNNQGCTASGGWSGSVAASGSQSVTPTATGTSTYTLTCSNSAGSSPAGSAALTVDAAASTTGGASTAAASTGGGKSGGGALDLWSLTGLAALAAARTRRGRVQPAARRRILRI